MPVLSYVQPFSFTNQDGKQVTEKVLQNKITVVEYFFTTCKGICPKLNKNMKEIYLVYKDNPDFQGAFHDKKLKNTKGDRPKPKAKGPAKPGAPKKKSKRFDKKK